MIRYNTRYIKTYRTAWAVRWDLILVELWDEPGTPKHNSSQLFLSFVEKSVFTQECSQKAQKKQGKMSLFDDTILCSNFGSHYELDLGFTVPESCILSGLWLLFSVFNLWIKNFKTIMKKSVVKWYMCLCAHLWIHACVRITHMALQWKEENLLVWAVQMTVHHCTVLALAETMFRSVSMIRFQENSR